jgi:hypothetical protein
VGASRATGCIEANHAVVGYANEGVAELADWGLFKEPSAGRRNAPKQLLRSRERGSLLQQRSRVLQRSIAALPSRAGPLTQQAIGMQERLKATATPIPLDVLCNTASNLPDHVDQHSSLLRHFNRHHRSHHRDQAQNALCRALRSSSGMLSRLWSSLTRICHGLAWWTRSVTCGQKDTDA